MPKNSTSQNTTSDATGDQSNNSYYKPYGGWTGFMHSHGLKPWDDDDVEEGKRIIEAFKEHDRQDRAEAGKK
jgi:hypothetical protein